MPHGLAANASKVALVPLWDQHAASIDHRNFRGESQYLGQSGYQYTRTMAHIRNIGADDLMDRLTEDGAFGCVTMDVMGKLYSRDLLDSVLEIDFLRKNVPGFDTAHILDIGCGYGRFGERVTSLYDNVTVACYDPIPVSRKVCEKYLDHRKCIRAFIELEQFLEPAKFDIAVNIHSWPECSLSQVEAWTDLLKRNRVPYLFVSPHGPQFHIIDASGGGEFRTCIESRGYEEVARDDGFAWVHSLFRMKP